MKNLTILPLFLLVNTSAIAQINTPTPDYNAINETAEAQAAAVRPEQTNSTAKVFYEIGSYLAGGLNPVIKSELPTDRPLTKSDDSKIKLLTCVERILRKNFGGAQAPQLAFDTLMLATDRNGWSNQEINIQNAQNRCDEILSNVNRYAKRKVDASLRAQALQQIAVNSAASNKAKAIIETLENPKITICQVGKFSIVGGIFFAGTVGVSKAKCLWNNGKMYRFVGPEVGFALAGGLGIIQESFVVSPLEMKESTPVHVFSKFSSNSGDDSSTLVTGVGALEVGEYQTPKRHNGMAIGVLYRSFMEISGAFNFRFFNGKRHWGMLIDQLN